MPFEARKARRDTERAAKRDRVEAEKAARDYLAEHEPIASWGDRIHLCQDRLVRRGTRLGREHRPSEIVPLDGVSAEFGPLPSRSASRLHQNLDARQAWLTISGPGFRWEDPVPAKVAEPAREFATAVNNHVAASSGGTSPRKKHKRKNRRQEP